MVILDTNIIIDHLRQPHKTNTLFNRLNESFFGVEVGIALVTLQELYAGKSTRTYAPARQLTDILSTLHIWQYSYAVAMLAGKLTRDSAYPISFPDAVIAATAVLNEAKLATLNRKDFQGIADLQLVDLATLK